MRSMSAQRHVSPMQYEGPCAGWIRGSHTGDILVKDVIFLDDIVDDLLRVFVYHKHLPLQREKYAD